MDTIEKAKKACTVALGYFKVEGGLLINWSGIEIFLPLDDQQQKDYGGYGVGWVHSIIVRNILAILDEKLTFRIDVGGGKYYELPIYIPNRQDRSSGWTFPLPDSWRPAPGSQGEEKSENE